MVYRAQSRKDLGTVRVTQGEKVNQKLTNVLVASAAVVGGAAVGTIVGKVTMKKAPQLEPLLIWTSGALIGVGVTTLIAPKIITKSQAASVLASD